MCRYSVLATPLFLSIPFLPSPATLLSPPLSYLSPFPLHVQTELDKSLGVLQTKNAELESVLDYLRAQPDEIDVDEAVQATSPLHNQ